MARCDAGECWARVERWLADHAPDALPYLPAGVKRAAVTRAERLLGYELPRELAEFLAIHNGSGNLWLHDRGVFHSLEALLEAWQMEFDLWGNGKNDE